MPVFSRVAVAWMRAIIQRASAARMTPAFTAMSAMVSARAMGHGLAWDIAARGVPHAIAALKQMHAQKIAKRAIANVSRHAAEKWKAARAAWSAAKALMHCL